MARLSSCPASKIPSKGKEPGDVYFANDTKQTFFAINDGTLICLNDLFSGAVPHVRVVGPQGERGERGPAGQDSTIPGPRGEKGTPGKDGVGIQGDPGAAGLNGDRGKPGRDGKDGSNGRDGKDGLPGRDGKDGRDGSVLYVGAEEIKAAHKEILRRRAATLAAILDGMETANTYSHGAKTLVRQHLEAIRKTIQE